MASGTINWNHEGSWTNVQGKLIANLQYFIRNGMCYVLIYDNASYSFTANTWAKVGTLPSECKPSTTVYGSWYNRNSVGGEVQINNSGEVYLISDHTGGLMVSEMVAYPI